ncbi:MAG TPA: NAD-dependent DNA ligase LigA [Myxococcota bacterium]
MPSVDQASKKLLDSLPNLDAAELEKLVTHHNGLYWDKAAPEISDPAYDKLVEALRKLKPKSKVLDSLGESKSTLGGDVKHERPMLSLDKCYDDDTFLKWANGIKGGFLMSPKIDGLACSLRYDKSGKLSLAATRGDGKVGDDITQNARGVKDIPQALKGVSEALEVRGEVYMSLSRFNAKYSKKAGGDKANPRNLAAGAIKTKDAAESAAYGLSFFAYDLIGAGVKTEHEKFAQLKKLGFPVLPTKLFDKAAELPDGFRAFIDDVIKDSKMLDTETDGVVVKADLVSEADRLGVTAHHPRHAIAYKFQGESALTTVKEIEWSIARTGSVNPVAIIEPIFVSGVTVNRVSLHNAGYAKKLGVGVGAQVEVVRRGGVIPHVERVLSKPTKPLQFPKVWPSPKGNINVHLDGDFLYLDDPEAVPEVVVDRVRHYAAVVDAKGFGEKIVTQLFEAGQVKTPADLYRLDVKQLVTLDRMGEKSAQTLVDVMNDKRKLTLPTFLEALGVERIGATAADKLATAFGSIAKVRKASKADLANIDGIGDEVGEAIVRGLDESKHVIDELLKEVKIVEAEAPSDTSNALFGKTVVFTGGMEKMDRKTAQKRVVAVGGKCPSGVSADLDYLVIGDEGSPLLGGGAKSSKHTSADKLVAKGAKLKIISETDFLKMLG